jgi:hypothetical protein
MNKLNMETEDLERQITLLNLNSNEKAKNYKSKSLFLEGGVYYERPEDGSIQENLSDEQKLGLIKNFIPLRTMKEKEYLLDLPTHRPWVRYYNLRSKQFRLGGLLCKVHFPDYIILMNYRTKVYWSVQLEHNIIYVSNRDYTKLITPKTQDYIIKNKLLNLYKRGKLQLVGSESDTDEDDEDYKKSYDAYNKTYNQAYNETYNQAYDDAYNETYTEEQEQAYNTYTEDDTTTEADKKIIHINRATPARSVSKINVQKERSPKKKKSPKMKSPKKKSPKKQSKKK